jgi:hypothetical protein
MSLSKSLPRLFCSPAVAEGQMRCDLTRPFLDFPHRLSARVVAPFLFLVAGEVGTIQHLGPAEHDRAINE